MMILVLILVMVGSFYGGYKVRQAQFYEIEQPIMKLGTKVEELKRYKFMVKTHCRCGAAKEYDTDDI